MFHFDRSAWWQRGAILLLLLLPFLAFGRSLLQGFAPIDDAYLVVQNLATRGPTFEHLKTAFTTFDPELYIPATLMSFQLNYLISGLAPWSYHLVNILLHGLNAVLVFFVLKKLTDAPRASLFAAALFAAHPLNAEAVVWITARKDLLSTCFALAAILVYLKRTTGSYFLALALFLLALLAKVSVAPLPITFLIFDRMQEGKWSLKSLRRTLPFFCLSGMFIAVALLGKERIMQTTHLAETLLLIPRATLFLLGKFLLPGNVSPLYEISDSITLVHPAIFLPILACFAFLTCLVFCIRATQPRRAAPFLRDLGLSSLIFFVLLSPAFLTFRKAGTVFLTSDRYAYLPELGLLCAAVFVMVAIDRRLHVPKQMIASASAFLIALLCMLSVKQTAIWNSPDTLFAHALSVTPRSVAARTALAQTLLDQEKPQEAFALLKEGLKQGDAARLHVMAGKIYAHVGQVRDAIVEFEKAQKLDPGNAEAAFSIGSVLEQTGRRQEALSRYREAVALDASDVPSLIGIGRILRSQGDLAGAEQALRRALAWNPNAKEAHQGLAPILAKTGRVDEAEVHVRLANELSNP